MGNYSITFDGKEYELTPYSIGIAMKADEVAKVSVNPDKTVAERLKALFNFIQTALGASATAELIGEFNEADPNVLNIVFLMTIRAYNKPFEEYKSDSAAETLNDKDMSKLLKLLEALPNLDRLDKLNKSGR